MTTRIYTTLAPREVDFLDGCIERASTVMQDNRPESTRGRGSRARVAWRVLGTWGGEWMVSCRTPLCLRDGLEPGCAIGDGSDEAMVEWLLDDKKGGG